MTPRRARDVALSVVLLALVAGCGVFGPGPGSGSGSGSGPTARPSLSASPVEPDAGSASRGTAGTARALRGFYRQRLAWAACEDGLRCARLRVPLDYARPGGRTISLALLKVPATDRRRRLGSMVVNPGGPGGSGVDYAAAATRVFGAELRRVFDVVGFDPRGVARSAPLDCVTDGQLDELVRADVDPDTAAERRTFQRQTRALGAGCLRRSGALARHMSTVEVAKDLDVLRAALGDRRLTYFGASYGTYIGATYADAFPRRVGRMVLDGALDPISSSLEVNLGQARGFETALRAYVAACVSRGGCFLGGTADAGTARVRSWLRSVEARPLRTSTEERLTSGTAFYGLIYPLYDKRLWSVLDRGLQNAFAGDGSLMLSLADAYLQRTPDGRYADNSFEALVAVNCLDHDDAISVSQVPGQLPRFRRASPTFGASAAYSAATCSLWPVHTGRVPRRVRATGAPPILVVGTTRDPATPLAWARSLADQLDSGVLVTRDGDGHTGYRQGSPCVDRTVEAYLVSGRVPGGNVRC